MWHIRKSTTMHMAISERAQRHSRHFRRHRQEPTNARLELDPREHAERRPLFRHQHRLLRSRHQARLSHRSQSRPLASVANRSVQLQLDEWFNTPSFSLNYHQISTNISILISKAPVFVASMTIGDYVYFFIRETAIEYMNCGQVCYHHYNEI